MFYFLAQTQQAQPECHRLDLRSLLIMPVQRIPRYNLLLGELLKETPNTHPDHADLTTAVAAMKQVAEHVCFSCYCLCCFVYFSFLCCNVCPSHERR